MKLNQFWKDLLTNGAILGAVMTVSHCFEQSALIYGGTISWITVLGIESIAAFVLYIYLAYRFTKSYAANVMEQQQGVKLFTYGSGLSYVISLSILTGVMVGVGGHIFHNNIVGHSEYVTKYAEVLVQFMKASPESANLVDMNQMINVILQQPEPTIWATIASSIWNYMVLGLIVGLGIAAFTKHTPELFDKQQEENNAE